MDGLKDKILFIFAAIILGLAVVVFLLFRQVKQANNRAERWETNYYSPDRQTMSAKEFKEWVKINNSHVIDSLNKMLDLKLKPKNITNYQTITNNYKDTNIVNIPVTETDFGIYPVSFMDDKNCWGMQGFFNYPDKTFQLSERMSNDSIYSLEYYTQKKILWIIPIAPKKYFRQTWSTCKGKISETQIDIEKKPD